ncbi:hypothetical protein SAMN04487948_101170 [Halogranum amylolyticum]|uniref:Uncharacterized protein n=1 Tax=Halogranum amylolyticum TaxID=660520 RepID=A0A1H8MY09_9EURY|nr:hypothetical protein [Halogranum amylolyticum]SEO22153.1 hypothetical protein SAMN04487948_101170 [Halogranum amylolyticum]
MSTRTTGQPNFSQIRDGLVRVDAELDVFDADRLPEPAEPSL